MRSAISVLFAICFPSYFSVFFFVEVLAGFFVCLGFAFISSIISRYLSASYFFADFPSISMVEPTGWPLKTAFVFTLSLVAMCESLYLALQYLVDNVCFSSVTNNVASY